MRKIALILLFLIGAPAFAKDVYVDGYIRKDGTYVQPHHRSSPNSNPYDNYGTKGNINPYTGQVGTENPNNSYQNQYDYTQPRQRRNNNGF